MSIKQIYLRRTNKVIPRIGTSAGHLDIRVIATIAKNLEDLGYTLSSEVIDILKTQTPEQAMRFYNFTVKVLKEMVGAHRRHRPMYPNFPKQVMEMSEAELYLRAVIYYVTGWHEKFDKEPRLPLNANSKLIVLNLGSLEDFADTMRNLAKANTSISDTDKQDLATYIEWSGKDSVIGFYAKGVPLCPNKENSAFIAAELMNNEALDPMPFIKENLKTATDILRFAVALSGGDVSLAEPAKFRNFKRSERRLLLAALNEVPVPMAVEDMLRWKSRWLRLGESIHPSEYRKKYTNSASSFDYIRNDLGFKTFNSKVENAIASVDTKTAVELLKNRAGDFARRLDKLLRENRRNNHLVISAFRDTAVNVSTPVLLQTLGHFRERANEMATRSAKGQVKDFRMFMPKGNVSKIQVIKNELSPVLNSSVNDILDITRNALETKFSALPKLGACYIDERLKGYLVPFSQRTASKSLKTLVRGSRTDFPDGKFLRFFIWWKNGDDRVDIDLAAAGYDENFKYVSAITYYNLTQFDGCHSGDITDAPYGASEFIDINIAKAAKKVRYMAMQVYSYTHQKYIDLPECFAGWMMRSDSESGEIFEPKTVQDKSDLTANSSTAMPYVFDLQERKAIWVDMNLTSTRPINNARSHRGTTEQILKGFVTLEKANLYDLFSMHVQGRGGRLVAAPEDAEITFSPDAGSTITPFDTEVLMAEYMK